MSAVRLALAIPTYRRAAAVAANLAAIAADARRLGLRIWVSDDSPDEETRLAVRPYADIVEYRQNVPPLGHDANVLGTLLWPEADYIWLLGDALRPGTGELEAMLRFLDGQDMVFINENARDERTVPHAAGAAARRLVRDKSWHQTLTGATIYHRRVQEWARHGGFASYRNFPQLSVILGYCAHHDPVLAWHGRRVLRAEPKGDSYWLPAALDVFVSDWAAVIAGHAALFEPGVGAAIRAHSRHTNLFNIAFLADLRLNGRLTWAALRQPHFWDAMHLPRAAVLGVMVAPRAVRRIETMLGGARSRSGRTARRLRAWLGRPSCT